MVCLYKQRVSFPHSAFSCRLSNVVFDISGFPRFCNLFKVVCFKIIQPATNRPRVSFRRGSVAGTRMEHYRADGVRIAHDPFAPGVAEKYGTPGKTDQ